MKTYLFLHCCIFLCLCGNAQKGMRFELRNQLGDSEIISGRLERIVKTYHCAADNVGEQQIILYGTKAWSFPPQTVNLTLQYPPANSGRELGNADGYVITGLLVVLHMDGADSRGYVTEGGILMDRISLTFVIKNISRLFYQFWLYGVRQSHVNVAEHIVTHNWC